MVARDSKGPMRKNGMVRGSVGTGGNKQDHVNFRKC